MSTHLHWLAALQVVLLCVGSAWAEVEGAGPNLLIIQTDEHSFRTLGCYRQQLPEDHAYVWGAGVDVKTPYIDSLARDGALFLNYYAASPLCTPSRASFVSGLYPHATGAFGNNKPLHDDVVTFAQILGDNGYATAYVGKWHLDGDAKPGWAPDRKFGFNDNRYMFNRGHWKLLDDTDGGPGLVGTFDAESNRYKFTIEDSSEESYTTDFLTRRTLEILQREKDGPFCVMLSLPDPHGPNAVRAPYDTMFKDTVFGKPVSMRATLADPDSVPKWNRIKTKSAAPEIDQNLMRQYFGMVKCVDDNVGKILDYLDSSGLADNTIVVFTSDHGDMLYEHLQHNKGLPYETSAKIPFVIRYPGRIPAGGVIETACTTVDFAPTVLGLMGIAGDLPEFHGEDGTSELIGGGSRRASPRTVYIRSAHNRWVAAIRGQHKLVLSGADRPWLFDLSLDPDELVNFYGEPTHADIAAGLQDDLIRLMGEFDEPVLAKDSLLYE